MFLARHAERRQKGKLDGSLDVFKRQLDAEQQKLSSELSTFSLSEARGWLATGESGPNSIAPPSPGPCSSCDGCRLLVSRGSDHGISGEVIDGEDPLRTPGIHQGRPVRKGASGCR